MSKIETQNQLLIEVNKLETKISKLEILTDKIANKSENLDKSEILELFSNKLEEIRDKMDIHWDKWEDLYNIYKKMVKTYGKTKKLSMIKIKLDNLEFDMGSIYEFTQGHGLWF